MEKQSKGRLPLIFNIQRFSMHDGRGVRTTVFFKGCGLRCWWCHNPESQSFDQEISFYQQRCVQCHQCILSCPEKAVKINEEQSLTINRELCKSCGSCLDSCYYNAREMIGQYYDINDLFKILLKDEIIYEESKGGVTFSGGEVMSQPFNYILKLAERLVNYGVSVNIDTCGYAPSQRFERIFPYVEEFLYDLKFIDSSLHKRYTGCDNSLILTNLRYLNSVGARINIRIPLIEDISATDNNIYSISEWMLDNKIHPVKINLLPYHSVGSDKYNHLDKKENFHIGMSAPAPDRVQEIKKFFKSQGFNNVVIGG